MNRQLHSASVIVLTTVLCLAANAAPELRFESVPVAGVRNAAALSTAWADFDGDADLDLVVTYATGEVVLLRNRRGGLDLVTAGESLGLESGQARSAAWGDYDRDGDLDLYVGARNGISALYRNDGAGTFTDVAAGMGVELPDVNVRQASWIDYDSDGWVDLFVANRSGPNRLFRNSAGRLEDVSDSVGLADPRPAVGACWFDYDSDGDLDVFIANQSGKPDAMYRYDRGHFRDVAASANLLQQDRTEEQGGVGCSVADYDGDGRLDLFVATYGRDLLYRNEGGGRFSDQSRQAGVAASGYMVGASWGDVDNDGDADLFVAGYRKSTDGRLPAVRLFLNDGAGTFALAPDDAVPNEADHAVQWADFDQDGRLDLALTDGYDQPGSHVVYRNLTGSGTSPRAVQVSVLDERGLHTQAGAEVRLFGSTGKLLGTGIVPTGDGYNSQGAQPLHFGGIASGTVGIEVTYMSADGRLTERHREVDVGLSPITHVSIIKGGEARIATPRDNHQGERDD